MMFTMPLCVMFRITVRDVDLTHPRLVFADGEEPAVEAVCDENGLQQRLLLFIFIRLSRATLFRCFACHVCQQCHGNAILQQ